MASCSCPKCTPYAHRPVKNKGHWSTGVLITEIKEILDFRHPKAMKMKIPDDVPEGEGEFLVQWKGDEGQDWIDADDVFNNGITAVILYFDKKKEKREADERNFMEKLTHISSLYDIICGGIEYETENYYKLKIGGLTDEFLFDFEIVRENGNCYVWVNRSQVRCIYTRCVELWEKKQRIRPTQKEIEQMDSFEYARYLKRKDEGFFTEEKGETSTEEERENSAEESGGSEGGSCCGCCGFEEGMNKC